MGIWNIGYKASPDKIWTDVGILTDEKITEYCPPGYQRVIFILTIRGNNNWLIDSFEKYRKQDCIYYPYHKYSNSVCHSTKGWWIIIMHTMIYTYSIFIMKSRTSMRNKINTILQRGHRCCDTSNFDPECGLRHYVKW